MKKSITVGHIRLISPKDVWGSVWEREKTFKHFKELGIDIEYHYNDSNITPDESKKYDLINIGEFSFGTWQEAFIRAHKRPVILVQETSLKSLLEGSKGLDINLLKTKPYFIALTNWSRDLLIHFGINGDKIRVIPCAADIDNFKPGKVDTVMEKPVFLYVGSLNRKKGAHHAIKAFAKAGVGSLLILQGEFNNDDSEYVIGMIKDLDITDKVIIKPFPGIDKLPEYYNMCDVVIYPQSYEDGEPIQFGHPLLWGLAAGKPLISLNMGGARDMIFNNINGCLCDRYDDIASAMKLIAYKPEIIQRFGNVSREIAKSISPSIIGIEYYEYYISILNSIK